MANIKIYTTKWCTYCKMAKEYFKEKGLEYDEYDVGNDAQKRMEMVEKTQQMGVPVIDIGGNIIIGFDKAKINSLLGIK